MRWRAITLSQPLPNSVSQPERPGLAQRLACTDRVMEPCWPCSHIYQTLNQWQPSGCAHVLAASRMCRQLYNPYNRSVVEICGHASLRAGLLATRIQSAFCGTYLHTAFRPQSPGASTIYLVDRNRCLVDALWSSGNPHIESRGLPCARPRLQERQVQQLVGELTSTL